MPAISQIKLFLDSPRGVSSLSALYGDTQENLVTQHRRIVALLDRFDFHFNELQDVFLFSAPGRTELGGNHTDHENGCVLAAAINLDILGAASGTSDRVIRVISDDFPAFEIELNDLDPRPEEDHTSPALVRGICHFFVRHGLKIGGFTACITSFVPAGSGLSSSAAFEVLIGEMLNSFYNEGGIDPLTLALAGQYAEKEYFHKPCGLMDQLTSAVGGLVSIDFRDSQEPVVHRVHFDLGSSGHTLVIVETGGSHAGLTDEYAAIKRENRAVANFFGSTVLRQVSEEKFYANLPEIRSVAGDRAILRAMHFFAEDRRVLAQVSALEHGRFDLFLELVGQSGDSSWRLLQNCVAHSSIMEQNIPLALAYSEKLLGRSGAWRVHGGGFAGTIQAYVPDNLVPEYVSDMEEVFGKGACLPVQIRNQGVLRIHLPL